MVGTAVVLKTGSMTYKTSSMISSTTASVFYIGNPTLTYGIFIPFDQANQNGVFAFKFVGSDKYLLEQDSTKALYWLKRNSDISFTEN
jgi:hypothetical protein